MPRMVAEMPGLGIMTGHGRVERDCIIALAGQWREIARGDLATQQ